MDQTPEQIVRRRIEDALSTQINTQLVEGVQQKLNRICVTIPLADLQRDVKERLENEFGTVASRLAWRAFWALYGLLPRRIKRTLEAYSDALNTDPHQIEETPEPPLPESVLAQIVAPSIEELRDVWLPRILVDWPNEHVIKEDAIDIMVDVPPPRFAHAR